MFKIDGAGNVNGAFVNEDAATNRPPTEVTAEWLNMLQSEVVNSVAEAGMALDKTDPGQLAKAIAVAVRLQAAAYASAGGTADALTGTYAPVVPALVNGLTLYVRAASANTTTTPTFAPNGLTAKTIVKGANRALEVGDIDGAGHWLELQYDATLAKWVLLNPATGVYANQPGEVCYFAQNTAPPGFLKANGAAVSTTAYAALDSAIYCGDASNATALFGYRCTNSANPTGSRSISGALVVLPDLRGEFVRGWDDARGVDTGRAFGSAQAGMTKIPDGVILRVGSFGGTDGPYDANAASTVASVYDMVTSPFGTSSTLHAETRPRNIALLACIKF